ncbi:MAG: flagellar basal-body MS-ring/collar protein FliF [Ancalomicrobiaceae bacterium]|nr:flagellar basal-body MS-ring/collar protein FliF [Ancalomicrobiaceae bacterium]
MNGAIEFVKTLGVQRLAAMGVVAALLLGFFAFIIVRATTPDMVPLYSDLSAQDSGSIIKELDAQAITYQLRQDGAQILVPKDQMARLRMKLAEKGLPLGGSVGYEIFDKTDALGTTSFVQNINRLRALEGELSRTIRSLDRVQQARVHLVIPERQLFQRDKVEPSASIVLKLQGTLEPAQVRAIQHLVATAVQGMRPGRVSVVDETGRLLASGVEDDQPGMIMSSLQDRNAAFERRLETQVETILAEIVGQGRSQVRVTAELDYNRVTQTSDKFDPNGQVVRSEQTEEGNSTNQNQEKGVTVANQVPGGQQQQDNPTQKEASSTTKETRNYEISKVSRVEVVEAGRIKRLSVAVLVDGTYVTAADGAITYQPRQQADVDRIAALVKSAVGFDQSRGDVVEVVNLRFAEAPSSLPLENAKSGLAALLDFTKEDILRFTEMGVLLLMTLLVLLFAVRPLIKRITGETVKIEETATAAANTLSLPNLAAVQTAQVMGALTAGADGVAAASGEAVSGEHGPTGPNKLELAQQLGALQATSIAKVGDMIKADPGEAAAIVRSWLTDAA